MGESMWRRPVTELSSYPTELDGETPCLDQLSAPNCQSRRKDPAYVREWITRQRGQS